MSETVRAALTAGSVWLWLGLLAVLPRVVSVAEGVPLIESRWLWPIVLLSWGPIVGLLVLWWRWARRAHRPPSPPKPLRHRVLIWVPVLLGAVFLAAAIAQTAWFYVTDARLGVHLPGADARRLAFVVSTVVMAAVIVLPFWLLSVAVRIARRAISGAPPPPQANAPG
jgi:hypothetical protein